MPPNLTPKWNKTVREIMTLAGKVKHGEIKIVIQDGNPVITDYTIRRKPENVEPFEIKLLDD